MKKEQDDTCPKTGNHAHSEHFLQHQGSSEMPPVVHTPQMLTVQVHFERNNNCGIEAVDPCPDISNSAAIGASFVQPKIRVTANLLSTLSGC